MDWSGTSDNSTRTSALSIVCNQGTTYSISPGQGQKVWRAPGARAPTGLLAPARPRCGGVVAAHPGFGVLAAHAPAAPPSRVLRRAHATLSHRLRRRRAELSWRGKGHTVAVSALRHLERKETSVELGYSYDFGRGKGVSVRARQATDATASAVQGRVRPTLLGTPVALSASVDEGAAGQTARANANRTTRAGWAQINAEHGPSGTWASGSMAGAVHLDGQGVTFLGPAESFAVVDVPRQAGVPVRRGGRLVGKTNAQGRLVVGEVTPMVPTEVRVDDRALPLGTQLAEIEQTATAGRQAGMHLTFPVLTETARTFRLTGVAQVGYDGVLYLEQPRPGQTVDVEGVCKAQLPADLGAAQTVAEVACR
nr:fimbria/pilus outer membrane usher protein [Stenotrophomonas maltophilia]